MTTDRKIAIVTGVLFIVATAFSLTGSAITSPILNVPDYLARIAANPSPIIIGGLCIFVAGAASAGIALAMYPVVRRYSEGLAVASVGFRLIEGVLYMIGGLCLLSLISVGQQFAGADGQGAAYLQSIGDILLTARDLAGFVFGVFAFCVGGLMYYVIFYQWRLVPRWLSIWGIAALATLLAAVLITLFDGAPYAVSGNLIFLALPIAVQEIVLGIWLIVRGFDSQSAAPEPAMNAARQGAPGAA